MSSPVMNLCSLMEDIKTRITDAEYMAMLEQLKRLHHEYTWNFTFRHETDERVIRLVYSIITSGCNNPGKLAHVLKKKGFTYSDYLHSSFKEWMLTMGVNVQNNTATIETNVL